jgi:WD40 repeat protein
MPGDTAEPELRESDGSRSKSYLSSLFSVPPQSVPESGIYAMDEGDLDFTEDGKVLGMNPKYWIKDIDTGRIYSLENNEEEVVGAGREQRRSQKGSSEPMGPMQRGVLEQGASGQAPKDPHSNIRVSDVLTGESIGLNDFESVMGYRSTADALSKGQEGVVRHQSLGDRAVPNSVLSRSGAKWFYGAMSRFGLLHHGSRSRGGSEGAELFDHHGSPQTSSPKDDSKGLKVKVYTSRKNFREFSEVRLVQSVYAHEGVVWVAKFNKSGKYLATAGQDGVVAVWRVHVKRRLDKDEEEEESGSESTSPRKESDNAGQGSRSAEDNHPEAPGVVYGVPVLNPTPYRLYKGHKKDVLDLSWSGSNFLFSASMDKTVRLWHVSVGECLKVFRHNDFVTSIAVHPLNEALFLSGSIDGKVRLWNVPESRVTSWQDVHDMVTAVTFSGDGSKAVVGSMRGKCRFYSLSISNTLEYEAQLDVKNKRGQHSRGKKITGLAFAPKLFPNALLITSNDSRIRLYDGYTLRFKYKGLSNKSTQIKASFSPKGNFVICGSDDGAVYIWDCSKSPIPGNPTLPASKSNSGLVERTLGTISEPFIKEKNASWESFQVSDDVITTAIFAPEAVQLRPIPSDKGKYAAYGQVILTCGYQGEIKIYENTGAPQWL